MNYTKDGRRVLRKKCTKCGATKLVDEFSNVAGTTRQHSWCKSCMNAKRRAYSFANRERENQTRRDRHAINPEKRKATLLSMRDRSLRRLYGITIAQRDELLAKQGNKCACCGSVFREHEKKNVDHSHFTGKIRGVVCTHCNQAIGHVHDSIERCLLAAVYLRNTESIEVVVADCETSKETKKRVCDVLAFAAALAKNNWRKP